LKRITFVLTSSLAFHVVHQEYTAGLCVAESFSEGLGNTQFKFWSGFAKHVVDCGSPFTTKAPRPQAWTSIAIGRSDVHIDAVFTSDIGTMVNMRPDEIGPEIRVDFYIPDNNELFERLLEYRDEIERAYGGELQFYSSPRAQSRRIFDFMKTDILDETRWPEYYDWLTERIVRMREVLGQRV
jgi:Domain of unknown function (DUF4268)